MKWHIDRENILAALANELHLTVSYGVYDELQYILSRTTGDGIMFYCGCRIAGDVILVIGKDCREIKVCLHDPSSIEQLENAFLDDKFMHKAGSDTKRKIIEMARADSTLDNIIRAMKGYR